MLNIVNALFLISCGTVLCVPAFDDLMQEQNGDTAVVESLVREARAVPDHIEDLLGPGVKEAYIHTYGDKEADDGDVLGYAKKTNDKGDDGYKHFDAYHKKDSDKYGFEVHSEFGQADKANYDSADDSGKHSEEEKENSEDGSDGADETKNAYQVSEELDDENKNNKAIDGFNFKYYADSGDSEKQTNAEAESDSGESEHYEESGEGYPVTGYGEKEEKSENYSSSDGDSGSYIAGADSGESEGYAEAEEHDY